MGLLMLTAKSREMPIDILYEVSDSVLHSIDVQNG